MGASPTGSPTAPKGLRPMYFLSRGNGKLTAMVPADELPEAVALVNVKRDMNMQDAAGMTCIGEIAHSGRYYDLESAESSGSSAGASSEYAWRGGNTNFDKPGQPMDGGWRSRSGRPAQSLQVVPFNNRRTTDKTPIPDDKEFCSYWLRHGECDYMQGRGCRFKHVMPTDIETLHKLGLREIPRWYRKQQAEQYQYVNGIAGGDVAAVTESLLKSGLAGSSEMSPPVTPAKPALPALPGPANYLNQDWTVATGAIVPQPQALSLYDAGRAAFDAAAYGPLGVNQPAPFSFAAPTPFPTLDVSGPPIGFSAPSVPASFAYGLPGYDHFTPTTIGVAPLQTSSGVQTPGFNNPYGGVSLDISRSVAAPALTRGRVSSSAAVPSIATSAPQSQSRLLPIRSPMEGIFTRLNDMRLSSDTDSPGTPLSEATTVLSSSLDSAHPLSQSVGGLNVNTNFGSLGHGHSMTAGTSSSSGSGSTLSAIGSSRNSNGMSASANFGIGFMSGTGNASGNALNQMSSSAGAIGRPSFGSTTTSSTDRGE